MSYGPGTIVVVSRQVQYVIVEVASPQVQNDASTLLPDDWAPGTWHCTPREREMKESGSEQPAMQADAVLTHLLQPEVSHSEADKNPGHSLGEALLPSSAPLAPSEAPRAALQRHGWLRNLGLSLRPAVAPAPGRAPAKRRGRAAPGVLRRASAPSSCDDDLLLGLCAGAAVARRRAVLRGLARGVCVLALLVAVGLGGCMNLERVRVQKTELLKREVATMHVPVNEKHPTADKATGMAPPDEQVEDDVVLMEFRMADSDGSDAITKKEFKLYMKGIFRFKDSRGDIREAWHQADADQSGGIDLEEFDELYIDIYALFEQAPEASLRHLSRWDTGG